MSRQPRRRQPTPDLIQSFTNLQQWRYDGENLMKIGMLWFDNNPKTELKQKIEEAACYYAKKYGAEPTQCYAHPSDVKQVQSLHVDGIEVRTSRMVLPHHLWLGVETAETMEVQNAQV